MSRANGGRYGGRSRSVVDMEPPMAASEDDDDSLTDDPDQEEQEPEYPARGYGGGRYGRGRSGYNSGYPEDGYPGGSVRSSNYPEVRYKNTYQPPVRGFPDVKNLDGEGKRKGAWGRCVACMCCAWKVTRCLCSHITLVTIVVAYCLIGAAMFEKLEAENEKMVRRSKNYLPSVDQMKFSSEKSLFLDTNLDSIDVYHYMIYR